MRKINELPQWQRVFLFVVMPIILIIFLYFLFFQPTKDEVDKLKDQKKNIQAEIENLQRSTNPKLLENLKKKEEETRRLLEEKEKELSAIVGTIPTKKDVSTILKSIGLLAKRSGLTITNVQIQPGQETLYVLQSVGNEKFVKELQPQPQQAQQQKQQEKKQQQKPEGVKYIKQNIKVSFTGTYPAVEKFMEGMSKGGVISYPSGIQLSQAEAGKLRGELDVFVLIKEEEK
ncbi:type 4a pilus biogenesis protein PilO [Hydrogenobacter hydrogenophilus]|uniref:Pilus assembly protein, PilO n=1 Tax=Hydrogenobacter hydrogenophilus TaxID=35835 RepID=A0A285P0L1_9AQUI|nr:type 4a pilus biogenesis protein PilO [Hydrogenobacter hydrogenophilus]SNZ14988.1 Pilus assembly protein, PilO [Hydrogenobacter hydrogenophilus]